MKTVYYNVKKTVSEITVTFWASDQPKKVHEEVFIVYDVERLRFMFKNALKLTEPFEIMDLSKNKLD